MARRFSAIHSDTTIYESLQQMQQGNRTYSGVVDEEMHLIGLVTKSDISVIGLYDTSRSIAIVAQTPLENFRKTLDGTVIYDDPQMQINGKVSVIAMTGPENLHNYDVKGRIVVCGNHPETQKVVIEKGAGTATILVSHDLGVVARAADRVAIMYAGKIVEIGTAEEVYYDPRHPYTWGLMQSLPALNKGASELKTIPGMPPTLIDPPEGDAFACRNPYALEIDYAQQPPMFQISDTHFAATWLLDPRAPKITPTIGGNVHV